MEPEEPEGFELGHGLDSGDCSFGQVWNEKLDEASGRVFFWNSLTGETRWERPNG